jgi:hypothetical protein
LVRGGHCDANAAASDTGRVPELHGQAYGKNKDGIHCQKPELDGQAYAETEDGVRRRMPELHGLANPENQKGRSSERPFLFLTRQPGA